jgi:hypothetical protein
MPYSFTRSAPKVMRAFRSGKDQQVIVFLHGGISASERATVENHLQRSECFLAVRRAGGEELHKSVASRFAERPELAAVLTADTMPSCFIADVRQDAPNGQVADVLRSTRLLPGVKAAGYRRPDAR